MALTLSININQNSQNISNNTSNITVNVVCNWTSGSYDANAKLNLSGTFVSDVRTVSINPNKTTSGSATIYTYTGTINHEADGTKTIKENATLSTATSSGTVTAAVEKALSTIPRASDFSLSSTSVICGNSFTVTITPKISSFSHIIQVAMGSNTLSYTVSAGTKTQSITIPESWKNSISTGTTATATVTVTTKNGTSVVGSNVKNITVSIPSYDIPINVSWTGVDTFNNKYLYHKSGANVKLTSTKATSFMTYINDTSYTIRTDYSLNITTPALKIGNNVFKFEGTDDRGVKGYTTKTVYFYEYNNPYITSVTAERSTSTTTSATLTIKGQFTSLDSTNTGTVYAKYLNLNGQETTFSKTVSNSSFETTISITNVSVDAPTVINVYIIDKVKTQSVDFEIIIPPEEVPLDIRADGNAVAIGAVAQDNLITQSSDIEKSDENEEESLSDDTAGGEFQVNWKSIFKKPAYFNGSAYVQFSNGSYSNLLNISTKVNKIKSYINSYDDSGDWIEETQSNGRIKYFRTEKNFSINTPTTLNGFYATIVAVQLPRKLTQVYNFGVNLKWGNGYAWGSGRGVGEKNGVTNLEFAIISNSNSTTVDSITFYCEGII
jgi:hypothetical protein